MMRSMFSAVSGLSVHQTRMDVIANNVSNVNTIGFKSSRTLFSDVFSQTVSSASGASAATGRGGTNPAQIGLGAGVASIDRMMSPGAAQRTDHAFDLMIDGPGFFIVGDSTGNFFTRNGAIRPDADGNLLISNGMRLMGWRVEEDLPANPGQFQAQRGEVQGIQLSPNDMRADPRATTQTRFTGNLDPTIRRGPIPDDAPEGTTHGPIINPPTTIMKTFHDSLGNPHRLEVSLQLTDLGTDLEPSDRTIWTGTINIPANSQLTAEDFHLGGAAANQTFALSFDTGGNLVGVGYGATIADAVTSATTAPLTTGLNLTVNSGNITPAATFGNAQNQISMDFSYLSQHSNARANADVDNLDGMSAGYLTDLSVGGDGTVMARFSNGTMRPLWQIPVAEFTNPAGLESVGGSLFRATANSGAFNGVGTHGVMQGGVLEMSNVDLSSEFTDMIITQRGFQANSRLISTSDEMLQGLVNL